MAMTPETTAAAYRDRPASSNVPLNIRYFAFTKYEAVRGPVLVFVGWLVMACAPTGKTLTYAGGFLLFVLVIMAIAVPVISLSARVEGGHLVVRGARWPGPEVVWSCTLAEASGFELAEVRDAKDKKHYAVSLRTHDGQLLALTHDAYPSVHFIYPRILGRLNAWLTQTQVF